VVNVMPEQSEPPKSDNRFAVAASILFVTCYIILLVVAGWLIVKYAPVIAEWAVSLLPELPDPPDAFATRPEDVVKVAPEVTIAIHVGLSASIAVFIIWFFCRYPPEPVFGKEKTAFLS